MFKFITQIKLIFVSREMLVIIGIICIIFFAKLDILKVENSLAENNSINTYMDPVDTAFNVEAVSIYTPNIYENLSALEEHLFFSQAKKSEYLSKDLVKNNFITEKTKLEREYIVEGGDTITTIAEKFNMHVATIYERNGLNADIIENIKPGDKIIIPAYDSSESLAWLNDLNGKKEQERQRLLELQKQQEAESAANYLASLSRNVYTRDYTDGRYVENNYSGENAYPYGWCTYYVASRRSVPGSWGNAGEWLGSAQASGYATGGEPTPGSIIVTGESWWGHVGIVESVNGGSITISEMNYNGWGVTSSRTISTSNPVIKGYIY